MIYRRQLKIDFYSEHPQIGFEWIDFLIILLPHATILQDSTNHLVASCNNVSIDVLS
jgi:hypothetical protein